MGKALDTLIYEKNEETKLRDYHLFVFTPEQGENLYKIQSLANAEQCAVNVPFQRFLPDWTSGIVLREYTSRTVQAFIHTHTYTQIHVAE